MQFFKYIENGLQQSNPCIEEQENQAAPTSLALPPTDETTGDNSSKKVVDEGEACDNEKVVSSPSRTAEKEDNDLFVFTKSTAGDKVKYTCSYS